MDSEKVCDIMCSPSLDGYTPNPLYHSGYCPSYMQEQCNKDGSMFDRQWEKHQSDIKDYNASRVFAMTFHQKPHIYGYEHPQSHQMILPPTTEQVRRAMVSKIPIHPAINTLSTPKKTSKKTPKKTSKKTSKKK